MKIISLNANGIRSAAAKGFFEWMLSQNVDIVCLQEIKAQEQQLTDDIFKPSGFHRFIHAAEKKGYSGVAIYSKYPPDQIKTGLGWPDVDAEGRYLQVDFANLSVVSLYLPSGSSGAERQAVKFDLMARFLPVLQTARQSQRDFVICGDWNIAHKPIDLKNWRGNQKNSGFLPEERAWLDEVFGATGLVDAFRVVNREPDQYTWWSNRGRAWEKNVGWRIDYQVVTPGLKSRVRSAHIYREQRFSDHAPLVIEYDHLL